MSEMHPRKTHTRKLYTLQIRFSGEELASCTDERGATCRLFYQTDNDLYVIYYDDPEGPAWLEDGRGAGLSEAKIRAYWPDLAHAL